MGFGSCVDIFTSASELFEEMGYDSSPEPKEHGVISTSEEFLSEFSYYFKQGAAAERKSSSWNMNNYTIHTRIMNSRKICI